MEEMFALGILEDENGDTVGARFQNSNGEVLNCPTADLILDRNNFVCVNATIDKNGFVRAKKGSLERLYIRTTFRGRESKDEKEAHRLVEQGVISVYHGNKNSKTIPKYDGGVSDNDYGSGFYLTPDIELAREWPQSPYSIGTSCLHSYTLDLRDLKVLDLTKESFRYGIAELLYNRDVGTDVWDIQRYRQRYVKEYRHPNISEFDVIIGYRADDSFFKYIKDFIGDRLTEEELRDVMQYGGLGLQVCLKSEKSFEKLVKADKIRKVEEKYRKRYAARDAKAKREYQQYLTNLQFKKEGTRGLFIGQVLRRGR